MKAGDVFVLEGDPGEPETGPYMVTSITDFNRLVGANVGDPDRDVVITAMLVSKIEARRDEWQARATAARDAIAREAHP